MRAEPGAGGWRRRRIGPGGISAAALVVALSGSGCAVRSTVAGRATAGASGLVAAYDWTRSAASALDLGGGPTSTLSAVVAPQAAGAPWLIAGTRTGSDGTTTATVWSSPNGVAWTASALAGADGRALAATAWGERIVVVGSVGIGATERAAVWIAPSPGGAFALVPGDAAVGPTAAPGPTAPAGSSPLGTAAMDVVTAGTQGVFATGAKSGRQAVWYSTDGTDWVELAGAERVIDAAPGAAVTSMLVTPTAVLAAGTVQDGTHTDGAVWTSPDGIGWHREVPADNPFSGPADHRIDDIVMDPTGSVVAVGAVRSGPAWLPASWISPDGTTWSQPSEALPTATRPQPGRGGTVIRAVTATQSDLLAVGGSSTAQRLWVSTDGQNWTETPLPGGAARATDWSADLVAAAGPTTVIVDTGPGQPRVLVRARGTWQEISARASVFGPVASTATPAALVTDGTRLVLAVDVERPGPTVGASTSSAAILSSTDGTHWRRLSSAGSLAGAWIDSMAVISGALVAVGYTTTPSMTVAAALWTSTTGARWGAADRLGATAAAPAAATTAAALGSTIFAVGSAPGRRATATGATPGADAVPTARVWSTSRPSPGATTGSPGTTPGAGPQGADLDATPGVGSETVLGSCSDGRGVVVVGATARRGLPTGSPRVAEPSTATTTTVAVSGSPTGPDGQATDGTMAATWASTTGTAWTPGTVSPLVGAGGAQQMAGCAALGVGFVAWGQTPGGRGVAVPALWTSPDGRSWTLRRVPAFAVTGAAPLTALAASGSSWMAVGGGNLAAVAAPGLPGSSLDNPVIPAPAATATSGANGAAAVWSSGDAGATWARIPTTGAAWAAAGPLSTDLVTTAGSAVDVVGQVDGGVVVWVGRPTAPGPT